MAEVHVTEHARICGFLQARKFDELSPADWLLVLKSFIREEGVITAAYERTTLAGHLTDFPDLGVIYIFAPNSRSSDTTTDASMFLNNELPTAARGKISAGLDLLVRECLDLLEAGDPNAQAMLDDAIGFENGFGGAISGVLAEEIVLNRKVDAQTRGLLADLMVDRSFVISVSRNCWERIQEEIPQNPSLAAPVMRWLIKDYRGDQALDVPLTFKPDDDVHILSGIQTALEEALEDVWNDEHDAEMLKEKFKRYPEWALELLRDLASVPGRLGGHGTEELQALLS